MPGNSAFSNTITQVKGVAILLVVLGHIASPLGGIIFSFHIPLFFFLGGIFIKLAYPGADFLKKNLVRLIVPYFIFGALGLVVNDIKNVLLHRPQEDIFQSIIGLLYWMDAPHLQHYGMVLWFLPALFWARILSFCLLKYLKLNELLLFMLCAMCAYLFTNPATTLPFGLDKGMVALPWVFMGSVFCRNKEKLLALSIWKVAPVVLLVFLIVYFDGMPRLDMAAKDVDHIFLTLPYTFSVIFLIVYLTHAVNVGGLTQLKTFSDFISNFGNQSMLVYVVHPYTGNVAYLMSIFFLGEGHWVFRLALTTAMLMLVIKIRLRHQDSSLFKYL